MACDCIIVGAGPAGLMAAVAASSAGRKVRVHERMPAPGLKLLATGGGRCNLTNTAPVESILAAFGRHGPFMRPALAALPPDALRAYFLAAGVPTLAQEDGCVFPVSQRARDVLDALTGQARRQGVAFSCNAPVRQIRVRDGVVAGVETGAAFFETRRIVLATGGCGYPALGSDGSGLRLAVDLGHSLSPPVPALVPLIVAESWPGTLAGIVLEQARVRIDFAALRRTGAHAGGVLRRLQKEAPEGFAGPVLFTHRGLSGPTVLNLSGAVSILLQAAAPGQPPAGAVPVLLTPRDDRSAADWRAILDGWRVPHGRRLLRNLLAGELPRGLSEALCELAGLRDTTPAQARRGDVEKLTALCAGVPLSVSGTEGWNQAMVTRGGVSLDEIDPRTLESRIVQGLFLAGEILDLDGPCGGYNLTWAFASGHLAGCDRPR
jgi:predicted Rossmann fold flavoprotein